MVVCGKDHCKYASLHPRRTYPKGKPTVRLRRRQICIEQLLHVALAHCAEELFTSHLSLGYEQLRKEGFRVWLHRRGLSSMQNLGQQHGFLLQRAPAIAPCKP